MKHTCQLCRHFCSTLYELRIDGPCIGLIGPCCLDRATERIALLRSRHPDLAAELLTISQFRELTRPEPPLSPYWMRLKPKWPPDA